MDVAAALDELLHLEARTGRLVTRAKELRADLLNEARHQRELTGAAPSWKVKGLGRVSMVEPEATLSVVDPGLLARWVGEEHPDWLVSRVDDSRAADLLRTANAVAGGAVTPEGERIPGVALVERLPYLSVRVDAAAKAAAAEAELS